MLEEPAAAVSGLLGPAWPRLEQEAQQEHSCETACAFVAMQGAQLPQSPAAAQLAVLDQLLWQRKHSRGSNSSPDGGGSISNSLKGWVSQLLLKAMLGRLDVQLQDCRCQFVVPWLLGPQSQLPEQLAKQQYDGVSLHMRLLTVTPDSNAASATAAASPSNVQGASLHEAVGEMRAACGLLITLTKSCTSCWVAPCGRRGMDHATASRMKVIMRCC